MDDEHQRLKSRIQSELTGLRARVAILESLLFEALSLRRCDIDQVVDWAGRAQSALYDITFHPKQRGVVTEWKASETIEGEPPPKPKGQLGQ